MELRLTSDSRQEVVDTVAVRLGTFDGRVIWEEQLPTRVEAHQSRPVARWQAGHLEAGGGDRELPRRGQVAS